LENKYITIYKKIAELIESGEMIAGETLPSENELANQYATSRETIRKALNLLSQNGYIQKVRGKGSIVLDISKFEFPVSGLISFKELAEKMNKPSKTLVHEVSLLKVNEFLKKQLQLTNQDFAWKVLRTREIDGEKIILDKDYFNKNIVDILTKEICENSIYEYLEDELGMSIGFAKKEIVVVAPTEEDRIYLDLEGYSNIVVIRNHVYLENATLFQYTESRHRPDKFRFVDFARRKR
jgi:GntR family transcriptional regulator, trehalose operon transcriptional repressor